MAGNSFQLKRSSVSGKIPDAANVLVGEPVVNLVDRILYTKDGSGNVVIVGSNLTVQLADTSNTVSKSLSDIRVLQFNDLGFDIIDGANGIAKVQTLQSNTYLSILSEGIYLTNSLSSINFTGSGVTTSVVGSQVTVDIAASSGAFDYGYVYESFSAATVDYGDI
jgi:hypothetical protein